MDRVVRRHQPGPDALRGLPGAPGGTGQQPHRPQPSGRQPAPGPLGLVAPGLGERVVTPVRLRPRRAARGSAGSAGPGIRWGSACMARFSFSGPGRLSRRATSPGRGAARPGRAPLELPRRPRGTAAESCGWPRSPRTRLRSCRPGRTPSEKSGKASYSWRSTVSSTGSSMRDSASMPLAFQLDLPLEGRRDHDVPTHELAPVHVVAEGGRQQAGAETPLLEHLVGAS